jgi:hypothetical protein
MGKPMSGSWKPPEVRFAVSRRTRHPTACRCGHPMVRASRSTRINEGFAIFTERSVNGVESEDRLLQSTESKNLYDWSPDGRFILYTNLSPPRATCGCSRSMVIESHSPSFKRVMRRLTVASRPTVSGLAISRTKPGATRSTSDCFESPGSARKSRPMAGPLHDGAATAARCSTWRPPAD